MKTVAALVRVVSGVVVLVVAGEIRGDSKGVSIPAWGEGVGTLYASLVDCNGNGIPDECDLDCGQSGGPCDVSGCGESADCDDNGIPDECQLDEITILPEYGPCSPTADGGQPWCENFETYPVGPIYINGWYGWGSPTYSGVGPVTVEQNHTAGGTKSMSLVMHETVRRFSGYDYTASSAWVLSTRVYIPHTMTGTALFYVQSEYDGEFAETIALSITMSATTGDVRHSRSGETLPLLMDQWVEIRAVIDFDRDLVIVYYDDALLGTQTWTVGGGSLNIAGVNFWSWTSSGCYFDDLSLFPARAITSDCTGNQIPDVCDIVGSVAEDCNENLIPDECEPVEDCQPNGTQDICELAQPAGADCNSNHIPDDCEPNTDCNNNFIQDVCDIAGGTSLDCNSTRVPDECELEGNDCNANSGPDECDIMNGVSGDCNQDSIPDECNIAGTTSEDCQLDGIPDECQLEAVVALPKFVTCSANADHGQAWCEDFEGYDAGTIAGTYGWIAFGGAAARATVTTEQNHTPGGSKSVGCGYGDTLRLLSGYNAYASPAWVFRAWIFVPATMNSPAFFLFDADYQGTPGTSKAAVKLLMDPNVGTMSDWLTGSAAPLIVDEWVEVRILVDFERDLVVTYYDDVLLDTHAWSSFGCPPRIVAVHLLSITSSGYLCDDLSLYPAYPLTADCLANDIPDDCDLADCAGDPACGDCNDNAIPDACEVAAVDCNGNGVPDGCDISECEGDPACEDCNENRIPDGCDVAAIDCNENGAPDECDIAQCSGDPACDDCNENTVLDVCDIDEGTSPDNNGNSIPDECDAATPVLPSDSQHQAPKNRYISIDPTTSGTNAVALQVELTSMLRCNGDDRRACASDTDCPGVCTGNHNLQCTGDAICGADAPCMPTAPCVEHSSVGAAKWVDEPVTKMCVPLDDCASQWFAGLADTAVYRAWTEDTVHIADCAIIPAAQYEVCATADGTNFSDPLTIGTITKPNLHYADCVGPVVAGEYTPADGFTNVTDVQAHLIAVQGGATAPHTTWVDLHGAVIGSGCLGGDCIVPQQILNVGDLQTIKFGYLGQTYVETPGQENPGDCP